MFLRSLLCFFTEKLFWVKIWSLRVWTPWACENVSGDWREVFKWGRYFTKWKVGRILEENVICWGSQQKVGRMLASTELFYTFCVNYELYLWINDISVLNWLSVYCYVFGELKWLDNFTANYLSKSKIGIYRFAWDRE